jgi:aryl-alcohol dehydrogenase (NADP+)
MRRLGATDLDVFPLCLGGNPFGWTADERQSFAVLDAYVAAGGNFIDTADAYWQYIPGNTGGESETIIGRWLRARGNRDRVVIGTKVGRLRGREGLSAANIRAAAEDSLRRLQTDHIDLYYAHLDDTDTPLEETLEAFDELRRAGKVRYLAASGYTPERLAEALAVADAAGLSRYVAVQVPYNLVDRERYEGPMARLCAAEGIACLPYFGLAMGFLTGKYRSAEDAAGAARRRWVEPHLNERGFAVLRIVEEIAAERGVTPAAVSLAWLAAQPGVVSALASARTPEQLADLVPMARLELRRDELERLSAQPVA